MYALILLDALTFSIISIKTACVSVCHLVVVTVDVAIAVEFLRNHFFIFQLEDKGFILFKCKDSLECSQSDSGKKSATK